MAAQIKARFSINIIENSDNEILLLKRHPDAELGPGLWGFPAGHIRQGETPGQCALRELREEIGEDIQIKLVKKLGPVRDSFYGGIYEVYLFHHRWNGGTIKLNREHTAYDWVGAEDYKNYQVMDGMDEDLFYLEIWPVKYLDPGKLPQKRG
jgi:8-oxo-dGTP diphosphatase